ncbi:hypothetical protein RclHR1_15450001 [Rhizophagus clarus]|uniref:Protein kinase domain-containing protein n=2 Tax=Rhizophagus clarus TaxID=94130 RepID=A0A2Z6R7Q9_9GLOM|nr:hypothetical protein RclHR1_15450001 [Rhizophagus clarus]
MLYENEILDKFILEKGLKWIPYSQFKDVEYLNKGGFGIIYKAIWLSKNENIEVAFKCLDNLNENLDEFLNEWNYHEKCINSIRIINLHGFTKNPDTSNYMVVMDYANNGNLRGNLTKLIGYSWNQRLFMLYGIISALNEIHEQNLIHCDFHDGNILNHDKDQVFISDLGLCRPVKSSLKKDSLYGVAPFMAPEVLRGKPYTPASDIYSFSMIMWEITSGVPPFNNRSHDLQLAMSICKGERPEIIENTPQCYIYLMKRCWNENPSKRPTASEVRDTIAGWIFRPYNNETSDDETRDDEISDEVSDNNLSYTSSDDDDEVSDNEINDNEVNDNKISDDNDKMSDYDDDETSDDDDNKVNDNDEINYDGNKMNDDNDDKMSDNDVNDEMSDNDDNDDKMSDDNDDKINNNDDNDKINDDGNKMNDDNDDKMSDNDVNDEMSDYNDDEMSDYDDDEMSDYDDDEMSDYDDDEMSDNDDNDDNEMSDEINNNDDNDKINDDGNKMNVNDEMSDYNDDEMSDNDDNDDNEMSDDDDNEINNDDNDKINDDGNKINDDGNKINDDGDEINDDGSKINDDGDKINDDDEISDDDGISDDIMEFINAPIVHNNLTVEPHPQACYTSRLFDYTSKKLNEVLESECLDCLIDDIKALGK